jgi:hypothetical protein
MDGDLRERNQLPPRQQAGRTYSGSKLRAVHGWLDRHRAGAQSDRHRKRLPPLFGNGKIRV